MGKHRGSVDSFVLRQIARGLYDVRQYHAKPAVSYPSVQAVIDSLGRRDSVRLQPTGA